jgi:hypothetical protein
MGVRSVTVFVPGMYRGSRRPHRLWTGAARRDAGWDEAVREGPTTGVAVAQHVAQIRDGRRPKAPKKSESGDFS